MKYCGKYRDNIIISREKLGVSFFKKIKNMFPEFNWKHTPDLVFNNKKGTGPDMMCELDTHVVYLESCVHNRSYLENRELDKLVKDKPIWVIRFEVGEDEKEFHDLIINALNLDEEDLKNTIKEVTPVGIHRIW